MLTGLITIVVLIIGGNGFAAGMVAVLHIWRSGWDHRRRVLVAALFTGTLPLLIASGTWLTIPGGADSIGMVIGLLFVAALGAAACLPLAIMVSRRLGSNVPIGDTFS